MFKVVQLGQLITLTDKNSNRAKLISVNIKKRFIEGVKQMLWTIIGILIVLWILGFSFKIAGGLIHILLVIALIIFIVKLVTGNRAP